MQETRVLVETKGTTGEETISYWFDLPIDVAEFEEKLGVGAESGDYRIIEKVLPFADEVHEHTTATQRKSGQTVWKLWYRQAQRTRTERPERKS